MIRTKEYCDRCESLIGEEHTDALIKKVNGRPGFPQLIWTFFRKGLQRFENPQTGEPSIQDKYSGNVYRLEFCEKHGIELNALIRSYGLGDYRIEKILDELLPEDAKKWAKKNDVVQKEHDHSLKEWTDSQKKITSVGGKNGGGNREHFKGGNNSKNRGGDRGKTRGGSDAKRD